MAIQTKAALKTASLTGETITQTLFHDIIDSTTGVVQEDTKLNIRAFNEGAVTGNARGNNSVDLQTSRSSANQVAAAVGSVILGGENNGITSTGNYTVVSGWGNNGCTGSNCIISGLGNNSNQGNGCNISGSIASNNALSYARVHGGTTNARIIDVVAKAATTTATATALTLGGGAEGATTAIVIPSNTAWAFVAHVVAIDVTNGFANSKKWSFDGLVLNDGGVVTVSSAALGTDATSGTFTGSVALPSADNTLKALRIVATGIAATTIRWTARVEMTQVN